MNRKWLTMNGLHTLIIRPIISHDESVNPQDSNENTWIHNLNNPGAKANNPASPSGTFMKVIQGSAIVDNNRQINLQR